MTRIIAKTPIRRSAAGSLKWMFGCVIAYFFIIFLSHFFEILGGIDKIDITINNSSVRQAIQEMTRIDALKISCLFLLFASLGYSFLKNARENERISQLLQLSSVFGLLISNFMDYYITRRPALVDVSSARILDPQSGNLLTASEKITSFGKSDLFPISTFSVSSYNELSLYLQSILIWCLVAQFISLYRRIRIR